MTTDMPATAQEQVISQGLAGCGLKSEGVSIRFEDDRQGYVITISSAAGAKKESLPCVESVAGAEFVIFENKELARAYDEQMYAEIRKKIVADAEKDLRKRGLWEGFPRRADFASDALFAEALERHCGFAPRSILKVAGDGFNLVPESIEVGNAAYEKMSGLLAAITFSFADSPNFTFGFVGDEAFSDRR